MDKLDVGHYVRSKYPPRIEGRIQRIEGDIATIHVYRIGQVRCVNEALPVYRKRSLSTLERGEV